MDSLLSLRASGSDQKAKNTACTPSYHIKKCFVYKVERFDSTTETHPCRKCSANVGSIADKHDGRLEDQHLAEEYGVVEKRVMDCR